MIALYRTTLCE